MPHAQGCGRHMRATRVPEVGIGAVKEDFLEEVKLELGLKEWEGLGRWRGQRRGFVSVRSEC